MHLQYVVKNRGITSFLKGLTLPNHIYLTPTATDSGNVFSAWLNKSLGHWPRNVFAIFSHVCSFAPSFRVMIVFDLNIVFHLSYMSPLFVPPLRPFPISPSWSSSERRPFPDGAVHAATGAHHIDQRERVGRGRLLLPAVHRRHAPPGGHSVRPGTPRHAQRGGEAGRGGGRRIGAHLRVAAQQTRCHPALDPEWPWDSRYWVTDGESIMRQMSRLMR